MNGQGKGAQSLVATQAKHLILHMNKTHMTYRRASRKDWNPGLYSHLGMF